MALSTSRVRPWAPVGAGAVDRAPSRPGSIGAMLKKLLIVAVLVALGAVAAKRLRAS
ncbi:MAG TPA: hypothetical protein VMU75_12555 [Acidimicrobiales bacterium]|nr:hypothetical protein [Acidimicrobiales bacterium]